MRVTSHGLELDLQQGRLLRAGHEIELEPRTFALLRYLVEHAGRLISKSELVREVWQAQSLSSGVTGNAIAKLRRALDQSACEQAPIETVHGRGYRFHLPPAQATQQAVDPFIGRGELMHTLELHLERARQGEGQLLMLAGEAGMGKTRSARQLTLRARELGVVVCAGAAYDGQGAPPYWPWIELLRSAHEAVPPALWQSHIAAPDSALGALLPELRSGVALSVDTDDSAARRFQLFDECARFLSAASTAAPLLLWFDDMHWADQASMELLAFSVHALRSRRCLFLVNVRETELAPHGAAGSGLQRCSRLAVRLPLQGLSPDEVATLAISMAGAERIDPTLAHDIHARTGGNPFFVQQLAELIRQRPSADAHTDLGARDLPPAVCDVIRRKCSRLDAAARHSLAVAAVVGQEFGAAFVAAVLDIHVLELLDQLEHALQLRILQRQLGTENFAFTHALLRETLYGDLPERTRGELHRRSADLLSETSVPPLGEIAHHYLRALPSRLNEAIQACRNAAAAARATLGFESAAQLLEHALHKLDAERGDLALRFELSLELGNDRFYAASFESAWSAYREAAETARRLARADLLARVAPRLVDCVDLATGDASFARAIVELALQMLPREQRAERATLLSQRVELALELTTAEREAMLAEAARLAEESAAPAAILDVAHSRAYLRDPKTLQHNQQAASHLLVLIDRHAGQAETMRHRTLHRFTAHATHYITALTQGDLTTADQALARVSELARSTHLSAVEIAAEFMHMGRALAEGRLDDVEQSVRDRLADPRAAQPSAISLVLGAYMYGVARARNQLDALGQLELPDPPPSIAMTSRQRTDLAIARAHVYALTKRPARAEHILTRVAPDDLARMPILYGDLGVMCMLAETYYVLGDVEGAARLYPRLAPFIHLNAVLPHFEYWGAVAHYLGLLACVLDKPAHASQCFERALHMNQALNMRKVSDPHVAP